jgi:opacity protein-like surface antigen
MKPYRFAHAAAILFAGAAQAQVVEQPSQATNLYSTSKRPAMQDAFDKAYQPWPRAYGGNEAASPNDKAFEGLFTRDPRLLGGYQLSPSLAIEAGYVYLLDYGFHRINPGPLESLPGTLNLNNFSSHLAVKYSVPLTDRLLAFGKVGVAHSQITPSRHAMALDAKHGAPRQRQPESDRGTYLGAGAQYRLDETTTIDAQYGKHGDAASKWGKDTNSTGVRANLKMGF